MERTATATLFNTNTHPAKPWYWPHVAVRAMAWARTDVQVGTHEPTNGHSPPTHHTHTSCRSREHNLRHSITAAPGCCTAGCCTVLVDTFRVIIILDMTKKVHHHHHHHHHPGGRRALALQHNRPHFTSVDEKPVKGQRLDVGLVIADVLCACPVGSPVGRQLCLVRSRMHPHNIPSLAVLSSCSLRAHSSSVRTSGSYRGSAPHGWSRLSESQ
jgi:hypothetical protein